jgi:hypothetical protein
MCVNLRARDLDCAGPLVVRENQSRRDLAKVDDMSRQLTALAAKLSAL